MPVPKKRMTSTRSGGRRSHLAKKAKPMSSCPKCKSPTMAHRACSVCGTYKGQQVIRINSN